jgi:hypothetical protein
MAARNQVSVRTIGYWCNAGTVPFYKHGRVVRFHHQEYDDALKAFRRKSWWETSGDGEENIDNAKVRPVQEFATTAAHGRQYFRNGDDHWTKFEVSGDFVVGDTYSINPDGSFSERFRNGATCGAKIVR